MLFWGGHSLGIASHGQKGNTGKPAMTRSFVPLIVATLFLAAASFSNAQQTSTVRRSEYFRVLPDVARVKASDCPSSNRQSSNRCQFKDGKANRLDDFTRSLGQSGSGNPMTPEAPLTFKLESRNSKFEISGPRRGKYQKMECQICF